MNSALIFWRAQSLDRHLKIRISTGAILMLAALLLVLPLQWVVAMILAAGIHELSHFLAILITGGKIRKIHIGGRGVIMETQSMPAIKEIICALAGPIGSFLLFALAPRFPRTAICGIVHGLYNLLPLFPMDGGRVLLCALFSFFRPMTARKIFIGIQYAVIAAMLCAGIVLSLRIGVMPILFIIILLGNNIKENPLAKKAIWRYNRGTIHKEVRP